MAKRNLRVLVFGMQAQAVGASEVVVEHIDLPTIVSTVLKSLAEQHAELEPSIPLSRLAVNQEFAGDDGVIREGDEVALIGLISGG